MNYYTLQTVRHVHHWDDMLKETRALLESVGFIRSNAKGKPGDFLVENSFAMQKLRWTISRILFIKGKSVIAEKRWSGTLSERLSRHGGRCRHPNKSVVHCVGDSFLRISRMRTIWCRNRKVEDSRSSCTVFVIVRFMRYSQKGSWQLPIQRSTLYCSIRNLPDL